jgi:hypothetical protein
MAARCRSPSKASPGAGSGFSETCRLFVTRIPFWSPVPARETCRRVGVCKASSTPSRPPDHYSGVQKQSYFPRRRYANTPTRFPSSPKTKETRSFVFVIDFSDPRGLRLPPLQDKVRSSSGSKPKMSFLRLVLVYRSHIMVTSLHQNGPSARSGVAHFDAFSQRVAR